ncbi:G-protein coupled receptor 139, partial [Biomphalaria pfeifferi]
TNVTSYIYVTDFRDLGTPQVQPITHLNLWFQCALAKFLPCILMVVYGGLLVRTLRTNIRMLNKNQTTRASDSFFPPFNANHSPEHPYTGDHLLQIQSVDETGDSTKENQSDRNTGGGESEELLCSNCKNQVKHQMTIMMKEEQKPKRPSTSPLARGRRGPSRHHDNSRTTRMLLLVITLFLITELPQAILIVLSATIPPFFNEVYLPLGDIMDMVALVNNGINFLLYCVMSRDFRTTLLDMMRSSMTSARRVPGKITTTLYRPTVAIFDRSQKSQGTLIVRSKEYST